MNKEAEERILRRMAKVHDYLEMWQGSQNLSARQKESHAHNKQLTPVGYTLDTEEIVKSSCSFFQLDVGAAFTSSGRSSFQPPLSAKDLPGGRTQILNLRRIRRIIHHQVKSDEDCIPEGISDNEHWLYWNEDLDNRNDSEDDSVVEVESDMEQHNSMEDLEGPMQRIEVLH
jgi:hypothetical protein